VLFWKFTIFSGEFFLKVYDFLRVILIPEGEVVFGVIYSRRRSCLWSNLFQKEKLSLE
jgi:hypothetical protein